MSLLSFAVEKYSTLVCVVKLSQCFTASLCLSNFLIQAFFQHLTNSEQFKDMKRLLLYLKA